MRPFWVAVLVGSVAIAGIVITSVLMVAYPGAFKLTAPIVCPDDRPDAYVLRYETQTTGSNGNSATGISFTLFCMNERGEFTEVGSWQPLGLLYAGVTAFLLFAVLLLVAAGRLGRRGRDAGKPPPPAGPPPSYIGRAPSPSPSQPTGLHLG